MSEQSLSVHKLFKDEESLKSFPETVTLTTELKNVVADVDIIISSFGFPEMTNATIRNYLAMEKKLAVHIIVVDSSGSLADYNKIMSHERVSKVLVHDFKVMHPTLGQGSVGMAISAAVGGYFSTSPYIFYSHNDMMAYKENFLSFLKSKLTNGVRLASFTQRHFVPFSGCMMIERSLLQEKNLDWMVYDHNYYIDQSACLKKMSANKTFFQMDWIDCGETYIYRELSQNHPVYVAASLGGVGEFWKNPVEYFKITWKESIQLVHSLGCQVIYGPLNLTKEQFIKKYTNVISAARTPFQFFRPQKYWRYCFDDAGELIFIHHGRGTSQHQVKAWLKFMNRY